MSYSITDFLGLKNVLCPFIEENSLRRVIKIEHNLMRLCARVAEEKPNVQVNG